MHLSRPSHTSLGLQPCLTTPLSLHPPLLQSFLRQSQLRWSSLRLTRTHRSSPRLLSRNHRPSTPQLPHPRVGHSITTTLSILPFWRSSFSPLPVATLPMRSPTPLPIPPLSLRRVLSLQLPSQVARRLHPRCRLLIKSIWTDCVAHRFMHSYL